MYCQSGDNSSVYFALAQVYFELIVGELVVKSPYEPR